MEYRKQEFEIKTTPVNHGCVLFGKKDSTHFIDHWNAKIGTKAQEMKVVLPQPIFRHQLATLPKPALNELVFPPCLFPKKDEYVFGRCPYADMI